MFDNFIREDAASLENTLFSRLVEEYKATSAIKSSLEVDVNEFCEIKNPLDLNDTGHPSPPSSGQPLEFSLYGPIAENHKRPSLRADAPKDPNLLTQVLVFAYFLFF